MMDIAQPLTAAAPIEQIISWVHLILRQSDPRPILDTGTQTEVVQELPDGKEEKPLKAQEGTNAPQHFDAQLVAREMVQHSE